MNISAKEHLVNQLLKELKINEWQDKDKILLFKAILYESLMDEYFHVNWIRVIERVLKMPWSDVITKFQEIKDRT